MSREIKFRAFYKVNKKMYIVNKLGIGFLHEIERKSEFLKGYATDEEIELMQYTGLKDKNGVEIYEGDIVKCIDENNEAEFIAAVEFGNPNHEYYWGWQLHYIKGDEANLDILCWVDMEEAGATLEVIGNIYNNPKLLEGGADYDE